MAAAIVLGFAGVLGGTLWFFVGMPGPCHRGPLTAVTDAERDLARRLRAHVEHLATDVGPRAATDPASLQRAVAYIDGQFRACGLTARRLPTQPGSFDFPNLEVSLDHADSTNSAPGRDQGLVIVGAHYDTVSTSPGADDNASGVAVLLELARSLQGKSLARPVRLVAFADEERDMRGSRPYASELRARGVDVSAMLSLEMLGYYDDAPGSQHYPLAALNWWYPDRGDFIAFVGNVPSRSLLRTSVGTFRRAVVFPCEGLVAPEALRDIARSDNASFWQAGYLALMVTDTSNFRNPHYHRAGDTPATLDYERMARVTSGLQAVVEYLAHPGSTKPPLPR